MECWVREILSLSPWRVRLLNGTLPVQMFRISRFLGERAMITCECSERDSRFARVRFKDGQVHFREVCSRCGGNVRGGGQNVGLRELETRGIDPESLPFLPEESPSLQHHFPPPQRCECSAK